MRALVVVLALTSAARADAPIKLERVPATLTTAEMSYEGTLTPEGMLADGKPALLLEVTGMKGDKTWKINFKSTDSTTIEHGTLSADRKSWVPKGSASTSDVWFTSSKSDRVIVLIRATKPGTRAFKVRVTSPIEDPFRGTQSGADDIKWDLKTSETTRATYAGSASGSMNSNSTVAGEPVAVFTLPPQKTATKVSFTSEHPAVLAVVGEAMGFVTVFAKSKPGTSGTLTIPISDVTRRLILRREPGMSWTTTTSFTLTDGEKPAATTPAPTVATTPVTKLPPATKPPPAAPTTPPPKTTPSPPAKPSRPTFDEFVKASRDQKLFGSEMTPIIKVVSMSTSTEVHQQFKGSKNGVTLVVLAPETVTFNVHVGAPLCTSDVWFKDPQPVPDTEQLPARHKMWIFGLGNGVKNGVSDPHRELCVTVTGRTGSGRVALMFWR